MSDCIEIQSRETNRVAVMTNPTDRSDMGLVILDIQEVKVVRGWNNPDGIMKCLDSGSGKEGTWLRDF